MLARASLRCPRFIGINNRNPARAAASSSSHPPCSTKSGYLTSALTRPIFPASAMLPRSSSLHADASPTAAAAALPEMAAAAPSPSPSLPRGGRRVSMLVVDFDETCSVRDSTGPLMAQAARARRLEAEGCTGAGAGGGGSGTGAEGDGLPEALSQNYSVKQKALLSRILPLPADASPQGGAHCEGDKKRFDREGLVAFLGQLSDFDEQMNLTAVERGAVAGMTPEQVGGGEARGQGAGGQGGRGFRERYHPGPYLQRQLYLPYLPSAIGVRGCRQI